MRILCYGDSNTWGYCPATCMRYGNRWTRVAASLLPEDEIIEEGLNSRNLCNDDLFRKGLNGLADLPMILRSQRPADLVIVMLGSNDLRSVYRMSADDIGAAYGRVIDIVRDEELNSPYRVPELLVISPIELGPGICTDSPWSYEFDENSLRTSKEMAGAIEKVCRERNVLFFNAALAASPCREDSLHLDEENHIMLGKAVAAVIEEIRRFRDLDHGEKI